MPVIDELELVTLITDLADLPGLPGREGPVAAFVLDHLRATGLDPWCDKAGEVLGSDTGNIHVVIPWPPGPSVLAFPGTSRHGAAFGTTGTCRGQAERSTGPLRRG